VNVSNLLAEKAEMHVRNLALEDYFDIIPNSLADGPAAEATVSFDVVWDGSVTRRVNVTDAAHGFTGTYVENQVTVTWSGTNELGFAFDANPGNFSTSFPERTFAEIGREHNGIFFPGGSSPFLARPLTGLPANPNLDPVVALLMTQAGNGAVAPVSVARDQGLASPGSLNLGGAGVAQTVLTSQRHDGLATDSAAKIATVARTTPEQTVGFVADPVTLFVALGQQSEDLRYL
jgi:hypothetical protein